MDGKCILLWRGWAPSIRRHDEGSYVDRSILGFANTNSTFYFNGVIIVLECLVAGVLFGGCWRPATKAVCAILFLGFSYYQLSLSYQNIHTCECMGGLTIAPKTMLVADLLIASGFYLLFLFNKHREKTTKKQVALAIGVSVITLLGGGST